MTLVYDEKLSKRKNSPIIENTIYEWPLMYDEKLPKRWS